MKKFTPVVKEKLKDKFWKKPENMLFAKDTGIIPVAIGEVARLSLFLPLAFYKDDNQNYRLIALLNLLPQTGNIFVNQKGAWIGRYVPWFFSGYPFTLRFTEKGDPVLLIDDEFIIDDPSAGIPFFKEDGEFHDELKKIINFLLEREKSYQLTSQICNKIAEMDILEPWNLNIRLEGEGRTIKGLYRINLEKYTKLEDEKILELRRAGAFILIYAHLFSLSNINLLAALSRIFLSKEQNKQEMPEIIRL